MIPLWAGLLAWGLWSLAIGCHFKSFRWLLGSSLLATVWGAAGLADGIAKVVAR